MGVFFRALRFSTGVTKMKSTFVGFLLLVGVVSQFVMPPVNPIRRLGQDMHDRILTTKVKAALLSVPDIASARIDVQTFTGTVTLSGSVPSGSQAWRVIDIVRTVEGVSNVQIKLTVKRATKPRSFANRVVA
jgi:hyperosmotically inducible periplasmic protein